MFVIKYQFYTLIYIVNIFQNVNLLNENTIDNKSN